MVIMWLCNTRKLSRCSVSHSRSPSQSVSQPSRPATAVLRVLVGLQLALHTPRSYLASINFNSETEHGKYTKDNSKFNYGHKKQQYNFIHHTLLGVCSSFLLFFFCLFSGSSGIGSNCRVQLSLQLLVLLVRNTLFPNRCSLWPLLQNN